MAEPGTRAEWMRRIPDAPDDHDLRHRYAAWLRGQGDHRTAEYLQDAMDAAGDSSTYVRRLRIRANGAVYVEEHEAQTLRRLRSLGAQRIRWRRGLIDALDVSIPAFLRAGDEIMDLAPAALVDFGSPGSVEDYAELAAAPAFAKVRRLGIHHARISGPSEPFTGAIHDYSDVPSLPYSRDVGGDFIAAVAASSLRGTIRELRVDLSSVGLEEVARAPAFSRLHTLDLSDPKIDDDALEILGSSAGLRELRRLSLRTRGAGGKGWGALARSPILSGVADLSLSGPGAAAALVHAKAPPPARLSLMHCGLDARGLDALFRSGRLSGVARLELSHNPLGAGAGRILGSLESLQELDLAGCGMSPEDADAILGSARLPELRTLSLAGNSAPAFPAALTLPALHLLDLSRTKLGDDGAARFAATPGLPSLRTLRLCGDQLGPAAAAALAGARGLAGLEDLELGDNRLGPDGAAALAASPVFSKLTRLGLDGSRIGPEGLERIILERGTRSAVALGLAGCSLSSAGAELLANLLEAGRFVSLDLHSNQIEDAGVLAILRSPSLNRILEMRLEGNNFRYDCWDLLQKRFGDALIR